MARLTVFAMAASIVCAGLACGPAGGAVHQPLLAEISAARLKR